MTLGSERGYRLQTAVLQFEEADSMNINSRLPYTYSPVSRLALGKPSVESPSRPKVAGGVRLNIDLAL